MAKGKSKSGTETEGDARAARLKAALKANISRRKAQAKARASQPRDASEDKQE